MKFFKIKPGDILLCISKYSKGVGLYVADEEFGPGTISVAFGSTFSESLYSIGDKVSDDMFFKLEE